MPTTVHSIRPLNGAIMNSPTRVTFFDDRGAAVAILQVSIVNNVVVQRDWSSRPEEWPIAEGQMNQVVAHLMERIDKGTVTIGTREFAWRVG